MAVRSLVLAVAVIALATGCVEPPSNTPTKYDAETEANFMEACREVGPESDPVVEPDDLDSYCGCTYERIVENVPFGDEDDEGDDDADESKATTTTEAETSGPTETPAFDPGDLTFIDLDKKLKEMDFGDLSTSDQQLLDQLDELAAPCSPPS